VDTDARHMGTRESGDLPEAKIVTHLASTGSMCSRTPRTSANPKNSQSNREKPARGSEGKVLYCILVCAKSDVERGKSIPSAAVQGTCLLTSTGGGELY
jgi:hypothetical protein